MVWLLRHRQTKGVATDRLNLRPPRHILTLPTRARRASARAKVLPLGGGAAGKRPRHDGRARPIIIRPPFVLPLLKHRQPRSRDTERCSPISCVPTATGRLVDSSFAGKSVTLLCDVMSAFHTQLDQVQWRSPTRPRVFPVSGHSVVRTLRVGLGSKAGIRDRMSFRSLQQFC